MKHRTVREQIASKCVHFNGLQNDKCKAGCQYSEIDKGNRVSMRAGLPCFAPRPEDPEGTVKSHCPNLRFPTEEEVQQEENEVMEEIKKMQLALLIIEPIRKENKGRNWQGVLTCPNCQNKLHVRHAGCNGHVMAHCETPGCVSWVE